MTHSGTRRKFFTQLSLGGSALVMAPTLLRAASLHPTNANSFVLRGLLPVALVEDCFDLAFVLPDLSNLTKMALAGDIDLKIPGNKGRLAPSLLLKMETLPDVLKKIKEPAEEAKSIQADKLSFLLGILVNNALHDQLQPVYQQYPNDTEELSIYQDTYLLRTLAGTEAVRIKYEDLNQLLNVLLPRTVTRVHTLIPGEDGPDWVVRMGRWRKENQERMEQYARIYTQPDPAKEKKYVRDARLFAADDPIIQLARKTQNGERVEAKELNRSTETAMGGQGSRYCRAVATGIHRIRTVDKFLRETIDEPALLTALKA